VPDSASKLTAAKPMNTSGAFAKVPDSASKLNAVKPPSTPVAQAPVDASKLASGAFAKVPDSASKLAAATKAQEASGTFAKVSSEPSTTNPSSAFSRLPTKQAPTSSASGAFRKVPDSSPKSLAVTAPPTEQPQSGAFAKLPSSGSLVAVAKPSSSPIVPTVAKPVSPAVVAVAKQPSPSSLKIEEPAPPASEILGVASLPNLVVHQPPMSEPTDERTLEASPTKSPTDEVHTGVSPIESPSNEIAEKDDFVRLDAATLLLDGADAPAPPSKKSSPPPSASSILSESPQVIPEGLILDSRYRLVKLLGEGGMGAVYKAEHLLMRKPVAIKILKKEAAVDRDLVMRFIREAQLASKLSNQHCVTIHDFGQTRDRDLYLVMELIEGDVLRDIMIEEGRLSVERAYSIIVQLLDALGAAHDIGVIHRDVKPENVMLVKDPTRESGTIAKLLDFGIARPSSPVATGVTRSGFTVGTPGYIAPEQALGRTLDGRTDLYAAAVIFYEMICGRRPYLGNSPMEIITNQVSQPPPRPSQVSPEAKIPIAIEDVLLKALAKEPDKRYANARELRLALEKALEKSGKGQSIIAPEPAPLPIHLEDKVSDDELLRAAGQRRGAALLAGLLGGLLIGASGVAGYFLFLRSANSKLKNNAPLTIPIAVETTHHYNPKAAHSFFEKGDLLGAVSSLGSLPKKDRNTPEVQTLLAVIQSQLNNWSEARAAIRLARYFGPFSAEQVPALLRNAAQAQGTKDAALARAAVSELGADAVKEILSMLRSPDESTRRQAHTLLLTIDEAEAPLVENARAAMEQNETCTDRQAFLRNLSLVNNPVATDAIDILEKEARLFCVKASTQPSKKQ
jgi:serine/threonine protein kinase